MVLLPHGHIVEKVGEASPPPWWIVTTRLQGAELTGFVHSGHLEHVPEPAPEAAALPAPPAVHWKEENPLVTPQTAERRASPIGDPNRPRRLGADPAVRRSELAALIDYLSVDISPRYQPTSSATYCNIYAYDYCYLAGVFLPRVWWDSEALRRIDRGEAVKPEYGRTIEEVSANGLYRWLRGMGHSFGWMPVTDETVLQSAANEGRIGLVCAHHQNPNASGHISAVVPETDTQKAARQGDSVLRPLQSQAGRKNHRYFSGPQAWWRGPQFREFGYWIHD